MINSHQGLAGVYGAIETLCQQSKGAQRPQLVQFSCEVNAAKFIHTFAESLSHDTQVVSVDAGRIADAETKGDVDGHPLAELIKLGSEKPVVLHIQGLYEMEDHRREGIRQLLTYREVFGGQKKIPENIKIIVSTSQPELGLPWELQIRFCDPVDVSVMEKEEDFVIPGFSEKMFTFQRLGKIAQEKLKGEKLAQMLNELPALVFGVGSRMPVQGFEPAVESKKIEAKVANIPKKKTRKI